MPRTVLRSSPGGPPADLSVEPDSLMICPLTGRTGGAIPDGRPGRVADCQPAASTTWAAATRLPSASRAPLARPSAQVSWRSGLRDYPGASEFCCGEQGGRQPPRIDRAVIGGQQAAAHRRVEHRLGLPAFARGELPQVHSEGLLEHLQFGQQGHVVAIEGHLKRSGLPKAGRQAGNGLQFSNEGWIAAQRVLAEGEDLPFGVSSFRDRGEHPGSRVRGTLARARVGKQHSHALLRSPPGDAEADDAAADDQDVGVGTCLSAHFGSLRRHDPDQVPAVGGSPAALSARSAPDSRAIYRSAYPAAVVRRRTSGLARHE